VGAAGRAVVAKEAGEEKRFLILETNYKIYAYTCKWTSTAWRRAEAQGEHNLRIVVDGDSERAGDCNSKPLCGYPDTIPKPCGGQARSTARQGRHGERDFSASGRLRFRQTV
jgi:hypothetical protein